MATTTVNVRMDSELKADLEAVCRELGMSVSTAVNVFARKVARERRIPFDVAVDPFYSDENMAHLRRSAAALDAGAGVSRDLLGGDE